jgi:hypothetical protein
LSSLYCRGEVRGWLKMAWDAHQLPRRSSPLNGTIHTRQVARLLRLLTAAAAAAAELSDDSARLLQLGAARLTARLTDSAHWK